MKPPGSVIHPIRVLYVDDEPALLQICKIYLEKKEHFEVFLSKNPTDAIALLSKQSFDAIISDYQMPGMDGLQFLKYLREQGDETPFVIFTGKGREEVVIEALNSGADFYLQKGGDPKAQFTELSQKIKYAVARKRSESALRESEDRYRNVIEDMDELICRFHHDGRIIFVNDAYSRHFGLSQDDLIGSSFKPGIHPDDQEKVSSLFSALTQDHPSGMIEQRVIMPDGRIVWQRWSTRAIFDKDGVITEYQSVGRDITELMERDNKLKRANDELLATNEELTAIEEELRHQYDDIRAAQKEVRLSEARYRAIFEYTSAASIIIEEDTTISLANTAFIDLACSTKEEVVGRSWTEFVSPDDRKRMLQYHEQRRDATVSPPRSYDFTFIDKNGGAHSTHITVGMISGTRQSVASFYDISDRVEMEEAIRKSEEQYRMIAENITETITVLDLSMNFTYVSPSITALRGYTVEEVMHQSLADILTPESLRTALEQLDEESRLEAEGSADPARVVILNLEEYRKDGSTIWVSNIMKFLRDEDGRPRSILILSRDITNQRAAEQALKENELFNRTLIEHLPDYILLYGTDGRILYINPLAADALGYIVDEMIGTDVLSYVAEEYRDSIHNKIALRLQKQHIPPYEIDIISKTGDRYSVLIKGAIIRYHNKEAVLLVLTDITERKAAEIALHNANKKLQLLSGITRHDIQNTLTVLQGYLSLVIDHNDDSDLINYLNEIECAADAIEEQIAFTSQYDACGANIRWQKISKSITDLPTGTITIQNDCTELSILADPILQKVFSNLLDNTIRHGQKTTRVHLFCEIKDDECRIIWEDDGIGIPSDQKEMIFKRGVGKHTGFGLFLSREILLISGITIHETGTYGEGARFELHIPKGMWRVDSNNTRFT
ncbi:PAS domain S-box protein [Methanocalculus sp.]|uniref:hybrid sensor histidine kinase/response regulator n=1 Tax=Methanocalculus sp. TaxID=2004547 RepID=UPI00260C5315|nr:PAS domain S-box protein [Methanocalculus sp.]MDG6249272.1 PAS domain S-box protein [Methanocalculus sp.]